MTGPAPEDGDPPGAAPERTRLAWQRTVLATGTAALLAVAVVIRRSSGGVAVALSLATLLAVAGAIVAVATHRGRRVSAATAPARGYPAVIGALVALLAATALALVVTATR